MKTICNVKTIFLCFILLILVCIYLSLKDLGSICKNKMIEIIKVIEDKRDTVNKAIEIKDDSDVRSKKTNSNLKYILLWTNPSNEGALVYVGKGREVFLNRDCKYTNCYVTSDRYNYEKFDMIAFSGPEVIIMEEVMRNFLPKKRSPHQKFVFASFESSDNYPFCSHNLDRFFNWTWTYKLDSDARWGYMVITDLNKTIIGPKTEMHWMKLEDMEPPSNYLKEKLKTKKKAAAWFVSNCHSRSNRGEKAKELQNELKKYDLDVDIYGSCGPLKCPKGSGEDKCNKMIETEYYFYLSFENSFSEDYVTEKLLNALNNYAVPIVYGGANYTRFMPDGIYLNARELTTIQLAAKMNELIRDPEKYAEYFKWRNHYEYHRQMDFTETDEYCSFCEILNNEKLVKEKKVYEDFKKWWTPPNRC